MKKLLVKKIRDYHRDAIIIKIKDKRKKKIKDEEKIFKYRNPPCYPSYLAIRLFCNPSFKKMLKSLCYPSGKDKNLKFFISEK